MRLSLLICFASFSLFSLAQPFVTDDEGHVNDPAFREFLKKKGYVFCTEFDYRSGNTYTAYVFNGTKWLQIDRNGKTVIIPVIKEEEIQYQIQGTDAAGEAFQAEPPMDLYYSEFPEMKVFWTGNKAGIRFKKSDTILPAVYSDITLKGNNTAIARDDKYFYFLKYTSDKKWELSPGFDKIEPLSYYASTNDYMVNCDGLYGVMDQDGKLIVRPQYTRLQLSLDRNNVLQVEKDGKKGLAFLDGTVFVPILYEQFIFPNPNVIFAQLKDPSGIRQTRIYSSNGSVKSEFYTDVTKIDYENANLYRVGSSRSGKNLAGIFDISLMKEIVSPKYERIGNFSKSANPMASVSKRMDSVIKYGYIDRNGNELIAPQFDFADQFYFPAALVENEKKWGAINETGKVIIPLSYEHMKLITYSGQIAYTKAEDVSFAFKRNGNWGVVNGSAGEIIPANYNDITFDDGGYFVVTGGKHGFYSKNGTVLINPVYSYIDRRTFGTYNCSKADKPFVADLYGNELPSSKVTYKL